MRQPTPRLVLRDLWARLAQNPSKALLLFLPRRLSNWVIVDARLEHAAIVDWQIRVARLELLRDNIRRVRCRAPYSSTPSLGSALLASASCCRYSRYLLTRLSLYADLLFILSYLHNPLIMTRSTIIAPLFAFLASELIDIALVFQAKGILIRTSCLALWIG